MPRRVEEERWIVQLLLPWWSVEDNLEYSSMTIGFEGRVDKRVAFKAMRKWYKQALGKTIRKQVLERVWKRRFVQPAMTEARMAQKLDELAWRSHEETKDKPDIGSQEEADGGAE